MMGWSGVVPSRASDAELVPTDLWVCQQRAFPGGTFYGGRFPPKLGSVAGHEWQVWSGTQCGMGTSRVHPTSLKMGGGVLA